MRRTKSRILAWMLTVALVHTTFASDFASIVTYADGEEPEENVVEQESAPEESSSNEEEYVEESSYQEDNQEEYQEDDSYEENVQEVEEDEDTLEEDEENSEEELLEESAQDATDVVETSEQTGNIITITYTTTDGGKVYKGNDEYVDSYEEEVNLDAETVVYVGTVAVADDGYTFKYWKDTDDNTVSEDATFVPSGITESRTYKAVFEENAVEPEESEVVEEVEEAEEVIEVEEKIVKVTYKAGKGGTVSKKTESVNINDEEVTFDGATATADDGYKFVGWEDADGNIVSKDATYVPSNIEEDATYTATFELEEEEEVASAKVVTITYKTTEGGSVSKTSEKIDLEDEENVIEGSTAKADEGYEFKFWKDGNGKEVSTDTTFVPTNIEKDTTYTAVFEKVEVEKPAISFHKNANGVYVRIDAPEGAFPKGTTATVVAVNDDSTINAATKAAEEQAGEDYTVEKVIAVDITFSYDGHEIEPLVPISVTLTTSEIANANEASVVHVDDSGNASVVGASINGNKAEFSADAFSVYAIVTGLHNENSRLTVKFVNGETEIASIYVKQSDDMSEVLYDPGVGSIDENVIFLGWSTEQNYTADTEALSIEDVRNEVKNYDWNSVIDNETTATYYAILVKQYKVTYLDDTEAALGQTYLNMRADKEGDGFAYTVNQAYTPVDDEHDFQGWHVKVGQGNIIRKDGENYTYIEGDTFVNGNVITITGDVTFSVNAPEGHWLIFEENGKGATYTAPQFVLAGYTTIEPDSSRMIRNGYTFDGVF